MYLGEAGQGKEGGLKRMSRVWATLGGLKETKRQPRHWAQLGNQVAGDVKGVVGALTDSGAAVRSQGTPRREAR